MGRPLTIIDRQICAPFFLFIKDAAEDLDEELMRKLGMSGYSRDRNLRWNPGKLYAFITRDARWVHLADDWHYSLWNSEALRSRLQELARVHELFTCCFGDCDSSHSFEYYTDGHLRRRLVVEVPDMRTREEVTTHDFGEPLEAELITPRSDYPRCWPMPWVFEIAKSLGIDVHHRRRKTRTYSKQEVLRTGSYSSHDPLFRELPRCSEVYDLSADHDT